MGKVIIGIHGLANKPPKDTLAGWWERSIREGLARNCRIASPDFRYVPVHWADLLYRNPLHDDHDMDFDDLYNREPYREAVELKRYDEGWLDATIAAIGDTVGGAIDGLRNYVGLDTLSELVLARKLHDLAFYYDDRRQIRDRDGVKRRARDVLGDELRTTLGPLHGQELMVIAHSMGSIIAYDVLRDLGQADHPIEVTGLVTIGSPLGLPTVKANVERERQHRPGAALRTPTIVIGSWVNFADRRDPVAVDTHLADDYRANARGIQVVDDLVLNDYDSPSHHKSYGYLRTPEMSEHIRAFLNA